MLLSKKTVFYTKIKFEIYVEALGLKLSLIAGLPPFIVRAPSFIKPPKK